MNRLLLLGFGAFWIHSSFCQDLSKDYASASVVIEDSLVSYYKARYTKPAYEPDISASARSHFKEMCKERGEDFEELAEDELIITNPKLSSTINTIFKRIVAKNELTPDYFRIFISREFSPNASSLAEGIIFLNLGLLERLVSEDALAFVIAHEMGHDLLDHSYKRLEKACEILTDKALKRRVKSAAKEKSDESVSSILGHVVSRQRRFGRDNELQADSVGFALVTTAGYDARAAIKVMHVLDSADYFLYQDSIRFEELLGSRFQPFKNEWLEKEDAPQWERNDSLYIIPDSLKTHPDTEIRVAILREKLGKDADKEGVVDDKDEDHIALIRFEVLHSLMHNGAYAFAFYRAVQMQKDYPENKYIKCLIAHNLFEIGRSVVDQTFTDIVVFPDQSFPSCYNQMLSFYHGMSSKKLFKIFMGYYEDHIVAFEHHEYRDMLAVLYKMKLKPDIDISEAINAFDEKYPDSILSEYLTNLK